MICPEIEFWLNMFRFTENIKLPKQSKINNKRTPKQNWNHFSQFQCWCSYCICLSTAV